MHRDLMIKDIRDIYPWMSLKLHNDKQVAVIHNKIMHEGVEHRRNTYLNFLKRCDNQDMYDEVKYLYYNLEG
jgi:hypothetical protein